MSNKKQKLDTLAYTSDDDTDITSTPAFDRSQQVCAQCHKTKAAHAVQVGKKRIMLSHAKVCEGECINVKCNHRSHASRRRRTMTTQQKKAALMAGFKPQEDIEFKNVLQQKLQQAGVDSDSLPGPAQLSLVIEACKEYASANGSHPTTPLRPTTSTPQSTSLNSVVHLLESTDRLLTSTSLPKPTSTSTPTNKTSIKNKFQCNHCSFVYDNDNGVVSAGSKCFMCEHGNVDVARAGATMSPLVFRSTMNMLRQRSDTSTSASTSTSTSTSTFTSTSTSTSTPIEKPAHIPDTWPPGKNCDVCRKIIAIKYCTTCMSYLCGSSNCMKWLHDATDVGQQGCDEGDLIVINLTTGTRSGKAYTPTSTSKTPSTSASTSPIPTPKSKTTSTSTSPSINDDMPELEYNDIEIEDLTCPTLLPLLKHVDRATQTETIKKVDVQVQTNYNMAFKPLTSNNIEKKLPSASAPETKPKLSIPFKQKKTLPHTHARVHVNDKENSASSANIVAVE